MKSQYDDGENMENELDDRNFIDMVTSKKKYFILLIILF